MSRVARCVVVCVLVVCLCKHTHCHVGQARNTLMTSLFTNYSLNVRPLCEYDLPTDVSLGLAIRQILELDEPHQILSFNAWVRLHWTDCRLRWEESDHNLTHITLPVSTIWRPDITLYDYADNENEKLPGFDAYLAKVDSQGDVTYMFPTVVKVFCKIDVTYFPFDQQICPLKFSSWAYDGLGVNLLNRSDKGDTDYFQSHVEWDLISMPLKRTVTYYNCCDAPYPEVTFNVTLKRKPLFYMSSLVFPCVLITAISLFGFLLPSDSGEKVSLEVTVLLSLAVFLLVVSENLPASSESFPYIGIYFAVTMFMVGLSTLFTVFILNIHYKGEQKKPVPKWLRRLAFGCLSRIVFVDSHHIKESPKTRSPVCVEYDRQRDEILKSNGIKLKFVNGVTKTAHYTNKALDESDDFDTGRARHTTDDVISELLCRKLEKAMSPQTEVLRRQLAVMEEREGRRQEEIQMERMSEEWRQVGVIADRFFLVLFTVILVLVSLIIFLKLQV